MRGQKNEIAIIDFGSQYTHLIARRVREMGVRSFIFPHTVKADSLKDVAGIILSGGPKSTTAEDRLEIDKDIFNLQTPILGLCYGHQLIANHFGGKVDRGGAREYGLADLKVSRSPIFDTIPSPTTVWMSHGDHVSALPPGFREIASTGNASIAAMGCAEKQIYSFQFHPEVNHSIHGKTMLTNFVFTICKAKKTWSAQNQLAEIEEKIRLEARGKKIFLLLSGGVDSTVCYALLAKVLGENNVYGFHVDHGFMRDNESEFIVTALKSIGCKNLHVYNAEQEFYSALHNIIDPEKKRKIIGDLFLAITNRVMSELNMSPNHWLIAQGTIYPDTIESGGTKNADKIKTHHNRVDEIQKLIDAGMVIEPLKDLYKDEVRQLGQALGLPRQLVMRHPFPGPGLAIRILSSEGASESPKEITIGEQKIWKLPLRSVGVQGDERSYAHPAVITNRLLKFSELEVLSPKITNEEKTINRVLWHIFGDSKKIAEGKVGSATLTKDRILKLRAIDKIVNDSIFGNANTNHVWQMPVVLIPFGHAWHESVVLRPVESEEAMTVNFARLPDDILKEIVEKISELNCVDHIFYDITNKPPGTIEWE